MIEAVVFDMDGVIFDSEKLYRKHWMITGEEYGYDADIRELAYDKYGAYHIEVDCKDLAGNMVTRELYFVYNNYIMIIMIVVVATVLMVGTSIWFGLHRTKKKGKCRHDRSSSI